MRIPIFHVDAFTNRPFSGNPAGVCLLDSWLDDELLQKVAAENNLPATAFLVPDGQDYELRWFTTGCELKLCGHATLAAGFVLLRLLDRPRQCVEFNTQKAGTLKVQMDGEFVRMDFPGFHPQTRTELPDHLVPALGLRSNPAELLEANQTWIAVLESAKDVAGVSPNSRLLKELHPFAIAVTAPGENEGFVTRYFAPGYGIPEDSVTGSVHCALAPYWSKRLGKLKLHARQLSARGGELWCETAGERVLLTGQVVLTMQGTLTI